MQQRAAVLVELGHGGIHQPNVRVQEHQLLSGSADELSSMGVKAGENKGRALKHGLAGEAKEDTITKYQMRLVGGSRAQGETHIDLAE